DVQAAGHGARYACTSDRDAHRGVHPGRRAARRHRGSGGTREADQDRVGRNGGAAGGGDGWNGGGAGTPLSERGQGGSVAHAGGTAPGARAADRRFVSSEQAVGRGGEDWCERLPVLQRRPAIMTPLMSFRQAFLLSNSILLSNL